MAALGTATNATHAASEGPQQQQPQQPASQYAWGGGGGWQAAGGGRLDLAPAAPCEVGAVPAASAGAVACGAPPRAAAAAAAGPAVEEASSSSSGVYVDGLAMSGCRSVQASSRTAAAHATALRRLHPTAMLLPQRGRSRQHEPAGSSSINSSNSSSSAAGGGGGGGTGSMLATRPPAKRLPWAHLAQREAAEAWAAEDALAAADAEAAASAALRDAKAAAACVIRAAARGAVYVTPSGSTGALGNVSNVRNWPQPLGPIRAVRAGARPSHHSQHAPRPLQVLDVTNDGSGGLRLNHMQLPGNLQQGQVREQETVPTLPLPLLPPQPPQGLPESVAAAGPMTAAPSAIVAAAAADDPAAGASGGGADTLTWLPPQIRHPYEAMLAAEAALRGVLAAAPPQRSAIALLIGSMALSGNIAHVTAALHEAESDADTSGWQQQLRAVVEPGLALALHCCHEAGVVAEAEVFATVTCSMPHLWHEPQISHPTAAALPAEVEARRLTLNAVMARVQDLGRAAQAEGPEFDNRTAHELRQAVGHMAAVETALAEAAVQHGVAGDNGLNNIVAMSVVLSYAAGDLLCARQVGFPGTSSSSSSAGQQPPAGVQGPRRRHQEAPHESVAVSAAAAAAADDPGAGASGGGADTLTWLPPQLRHPYEAMLAATAVLRGVLAAAPLEHSAIALLVPARRLAGAVDTVTMALHESKSDAAASGWQQARACVERALWAAGVLHRDAMAIAEADIMDMAQVCKQPRLLLERHASRAAANAAGAARLPAEVEARRRDHDALLDKVQELLTAPSASAMGLGLGDRSAADELRQAVGHMVAAETALAEAAVQHGVAGDSGLNNIVAISVFLTQIAKDLLLTEQSGFRGTSSRTSAGQQPPAGVQGPRRRRQEGAAGRGGGAAATAAAAATYPPEVQRRYWDMDAAASRLDAAAAAAETARVGDALEGAAREALRAVDALRAAAAAHGLAQDVGLERDAGTVEVFSLALLDWLRVTDQLPTRANGRGGGGVRQSGGRRVSCGVAAAGSLAPADQQQRRSSLFARPARAPRAVASPPALVGAAAQPGAHRENEVGRAARDDGRGTGGGVRAGGDTGTGGGGAALAAERPQPPVPCPPTRQSWMPSILDAANAAAAFLGGGGGGGGAGGGAGSAGWDDMVDADESMPDYGPYAVLPPPAASAAASVAAAAVATAVAAAVACGVDDDLSQPVTHWRELAHGLMPSPPSSPPSRSLSLPSSSPSSPPSASASPLHSRPGDIGWHGAGEPRLRVAGGAASSADISACTAVNAAAAMEVAVAGHNVEQEGASAGGGGGGRGWGQAGRGRGGGGGLQLLLGPRSPDSAWGGNSKGGWAEHAEDAEAADDRA
ncbi:hypothetical protein CHLRE_03g202851v5 [Chlamydomonas reinhardtii]|uniref:Uncharacterized protein n=1 Tax=Chlamydomonas reinhardtii TaxID=3055 RepID=A0A2K3DZ95_CHLRE|nr:uncharacterized protein CHLRE_03g202851v5 [Chlamydomonas reinhardtii]PNW85851.1 hypothetical protein CHLRE_03g202851v5 [Chlamydomonas reinhardtii]